MEEEEDEASNGRQRIPLLLPSSSSSPPPSSSSSSSSSSPSSPSSAPTSSRVVEAEGRSDTNRAEAAQVFQDHDRQLQRPGQQQRQRHPRLPPRMSNYRLSISISDAAPSEMRDDVWSFLVVLVTFWFFASMTLIFSFYGSINLQLGPNGSRLVQTNPLFVQYIKVEDLDDSKPGPVLFGFHENPQLNVEKTWTESHSASIPANFHKEWIYFLNQGSEVDIKYTVKSPLPLSLVIAKGRESLVEWIEDPSYPNTTLSWNIIYGSGRLHQAFLRSDAYYIAVGNLNSDEVEVDLNFSVKAWLYNTTPAYYRCSLGNPSCTLTLHLLKKDNAAVLTSPPPRKEGIVDDDDWYVKLSYGPRWITYFAGSGVATVLLLLAFRLRNMFRYATTGSGRGEYDGGGGRFQEERINIETDHHQEQRLLIPNKDDDGNLSTWGSSYESVSSCDDTEERFVAAVGAASSSKGKKTTSAEVAEGGSCSNPRGLLCVICSDSPRDSFFLPCGHCAACFDCGSRILEEDGCCPICRRKAKKVRMIYRA